MDIQKAWSFDKVSLQKTLKGLAIAMLGALATYLEMQIPSIDFGSYAVLAVAVNSAIINAIREYIKGQIT